MNRLIYWFPHKLSIHVKRDNISAACAATFHSRITRIALRVYTDKGDDGKSQWVIDSFLAILRIEMFDDEETYEKVKSRSTRCRNICPLSKLTNCSDVVRRQRIVPQARTHFSRDENTLSRVNKDGRIDCPYSLIFLDERRVFTPRTCGRWRIFLRAHVLVPQDRYCFPSVRKD